jgi:High potential iron-sulfur protein
MTTRRRFIALIPATGAFLTAACSKQETPPPAAAPETPTAPAPAAAPPAPEPAAPAAPVAAGPLLDEADPAAVALGYVADSARADQAKYPNHASTQACGSCALYQGAAGAETGPCPLFAGKQVNAKGWCASYVKKPA